MATRWCILGWTSWEREKQKGGKIMNERRKQPLRRAPHGCPSTLTPERRDSRAGTPLPQASVPCDSGKLAQVRDGFLILVHHQEPSQ